MVSLLSKLSVRDKIVSVIVSVLLLGLLLLSPPEELTVKSHSCEVSGPIDSIRVFFQGKSYWEKQIAFIDKAIVRDEIAAEKARDMGAHQEVSEGVRDAIESAKRVMEDVHEKVPSLRPMPAEIKAEQLRKQADELEAQGRKLRVSGMYLNSAEQYRKCRAIVLGRAQK